MDFNRLSKSSLAIIHKKIRPSGKAISGKAINVQWIMIYGYGYLLDGTIQPATTTRARDLFLKLPKTLWACKAVHETVFLLLEKARSMTVFKSSQNKIISKLDD